MLVISLTKGSVFCYKNKALINNNVLQENILGKISLILSKSQRIIAMIHCLVISTKKNLNVISRNPWYYIYCCGLGSESLRILQSSPLGFTFQKVAGSHPNVAVESRLEPCLSRETALLSEDATSPRLVTPVGIQVIAD